LSSGRAKLELCPPRPAKFTRILLVATAATALWAAAGCPIDQSTEPVTRSVPTGPGRASSGDTSGLTGPPAPTGDQTGAGTTSAAGTGPVVVGGDSATGTAPDALSVEFPDCEEPAQADSWRAEILQLVNQERTAVKLTAVTWNQTLADQAERYACEMIHYHFFDHVDPATGSHLRDRAAQFGYDYWIIGENLAAGQRSPAEVVQAWMNSPCHRENILNPAFIELGVGVRTGGEYAYYWVQEFGRPFDVEPYPGPPYKDPDCSQTE
jgi:uncharacterized protein YkwD